MYRDKGLVGGDSHRSFEPRQREPTETSRTIGTLRGLLGKIKRYGGLIRVPRLCWVRSLGTLDTCRPGLRALVYGPKV